MALIEETTLISSPSSPQCKVQHEAPALAFSVGEYTQNFFHDFVDVFIPLFITVNSIFPDQDFILVIFKSRDWWITKYADLLKGFSKHPIRTFENDIDTHCFPSATVGLITHGVMTIDPKLIPNSKNFMHFHALLGNTYGKKQPSSSKPPKARPRLVLASRSGGVGRAILNQAEVKLAAEEVGFEVIVFEPTTSTTLPESYALISSSHVMVGVHGAALTHFLFLRPGSVFVQIVPIGVENMAEVCFGKAAKELAMEYMEYKIGVEESSLLEKYGKDDIVLKGPMALHKKARSSGITDISVDEQNAKFDLVKFMEYMKIMDIYLKEQDIKLDLVKFKLYLERAYQKAKVLVDKKG
ncbi:hypothetical protein RJ639_040172 [Escallonia herrerae]|uniref:Glycosyltransferase 61 catalytic domain-containing protein n=1 Tax=Escallonia herrerae TaxID=1293975 RepID=A0AA89B2W7_9ASTE|nr:hypothetical protein RJ639_040172 [Escallonia herrerae]